MKHNRAVFLDRDGTLIIDQCYLCDPAGVVVIPGVRESLKWLRNSGYMVFMVTNQSGVGRGFFTMDQVEQVQERVFELIGMGRDKFAGICIAPEAPGQPSLYRKPSPRYLNEQIQRFSLDPLHCWMVGDMPSDWETGRAAGVRSVAVATGREQDGEWERIRREWAVPLFKDLPEFVQSLRKSAEESSS